MNKKEERQAMIDDARQAMIDAIDDGSVAFATPEQQAKTDDYIDLDLIASLAKEQTDV